MIKAPLPHSENSRLKTLRDYEVLDTLPERLYDNIASLASQICQTPIALVSLIDEKRQWFKARVGIEAAETDRDLAFCGYTILNQTPFIVSDAKNDFRFSDNPLVTGPLNIGFYAGAPLIAQTGERIGTLCVIDTKPRQLTPHQVASLELLAEQVVALLEMRLMARAALDATKSKSQFLANMSHEIRTPLGAMIGFTELLKDKNVSVEEREEFLGIISRNGRALTTLIDDILDLSKVESGHIALETVDFSLRELLKEVFSIFSDSVKSKGITLRLVLEPAVTERIASDPTRLRQILVKIIGNAIKFTARGGVLVRVDLRAAANGPDALVIKVNDTGVGLSIDQQQCLFRPFTQVDESTTRKFGGTGLGLVLSRRLAEAMGGTVELLESRVQAGSTFQILVRAGKSSATAIGPLPAPTQALKKTENALLGIKILLVEDSIDNQLLMQTILEKRGADLDIVGNGELGVGAAMSGLYDVVLMDIQMPGMDGYNAIRELRAHGYEKPVIALTAHAMQEERVKTREAGFSAHVTKPIDVEEVLAAIHAVINGLTFP